uniref:Uncharacterized protein LOC111133659 isoform X2 n=1 Tax=Crassostrea virginica TaxID=6565 RepID=A0A8B8EEF4_CRAVI|nr:uncharacterized protein LOC111133659 isoform X2 [Crassostrea virginica]
MLFNMKLLINFSLNKKTMMGILVVLVLTFFPFFGVGNPIGATDHQEWRSPCGGESRSLPLPAELQGLLPVNPDPNGDHNLPGILGELVIKMKETKDKVQELKQNYTDVRVRTGDCTDYLEASYIRLAGFPSAPAFKGAMRMISEMNLTDIFRNDYHKLSVVMIFIEQVRWDEETYENGQFLTTLNGIFQNLKSLLCVMSNALRTQDAEVVDFANRSEAMNQRYRTMSRADNHDRDYIIMRESYKLFGNLILKYAALKDFLSSSP